MCHLFSVASRVEMPWQWVVWSDDIELRAGDRIRWTRNDTGLGCRVLVSAAEGPLRGTGGRLRASHDVEMPPGVPYQDVQAPPRRG